ncbi:hypothetical protein D3C87_309150 [compost metagenome]
MNLFKMKKYVKIFQNEKTAFEMEKSKLHFNRKEFERTKNQFIVFRSASKRETPLSPGQNQAVPAKSGRSG